MKKIDFRSVSSKVVFKPVDESDKRYIRCRVLIVCEGKKTEPNYFRSFEMMKNNSDLVFEMDFDGGGINTIAVVDKAIELRNKARKAKRPYDTVWAVFDKDDFDDAVFDNAIIKAKNNGIRSAWSNEAFELWYVYHFDNRNTPMHRPQYKSIITQRIRENGFKDFTYEKNNDEMRRILSEYGGDEKRAIKYAERQEKVFTDQRYHSHNPATTVYKLVKLLRGEDKNFNNAIKKAIDAKE